MPRTHASRTHRSQRACALALALATIVATPLAAQNAPQQYAAQQNAPLQSALQRRQATRAELTAEASNLERAAATTRDASARTHWRADAAAMRDRLRVGDFRPGDRLFVAVTGDSAMTDTFTVRSEQKIFLPGIPEVSLAGVLNSELEDALTREIGRYLRHPKVRAGALVRVAVLGPVQKPGYFSLPVYALLSDAIMVAGGLANGANVDETVVRRGKDVVLDQPSVRRAMLDGRTISDLGLRPGDEIKVGEIKGSKWQSTVQGVSLVSGLALTVLWLVRR